MHKKLEGFEYVRQTEEKGRIKYSALIPVTKQTEEYKEKRRKAGLRQREFIFGSWPNPEEAEAAAHKYLETGEVTYGKYGYKPGQIKFRNENGKRIVLDPVKDKEEIERLAQERKDKLKARRVNRRLRKKAEFIAALEAAKLRHKATKVVVAAAPVPVPAPPRKLNALQVQEVKDVIKDVVKYKKRSQLFTIQFSQLSQVEELVTDNNVAIEVEKEKWLYLKFKRK